MIKNKGASKPMRKKKQAKALAAVATMAKYSLVLATQKKRRLRLIGLKKHQRSLKIEARRQAAAVAAEAKPGKTKPRRAA